MTKYQLEHFENKVNRYFQPLIDEQQLLIKQYRTEATNNVVKKLAKKMGADKILAKMKEAEDFMKEAQNNAKTFFEKASKKEKKELDYRLHRDEDRLSLSDCEEQLREWAKDLVDREIERRPEGAKLKDLKDLKQKAIDNVMESGTPEELKQSLNLVVKTIGLTWNVDTSKIKAIAQS
jgi:cellobiose-specific phosphotransferase system component IIA